MYKELFSNISCYEEYAIKCTLLGKKTNDPEILESVFHKTKDNHFWTVINGRLTFIDLRTGCKTVLSKIRGSLDCDHNGLTSLEGAPSKVGGNFYCYDNKLNSLKYAPSKVGGNFYCSYNQLTSLEGAPSKVGGDFDCSYNQLTSLEGAPLEVRGDFDCSYNQLTSLEGAPLEVRGDFDCSGNPNLSKKQIDDYKAFLKNPTPDLIDETGHYRPKN